MTLQRAFSLRRAAPIAPATLILGLCLLNCGPINHPLPAHEKATKPLRFTPDDGWVLTCSPDGRRLVSVVGQRTGPPKIRLWDLRSGRLLDEADGSEGGWLRFGTFSRDGRRLAVVHHPHALGRVAFTIRVWDVTADGKFTNARDLEADASYNRTTVYQSSFSPDGHLAAAGTAAEVIYVWDARSGRLVRRFQGGVTAHFAPDGRTLIAVTHDGEVRRFETGTWKFLGPAQPFKRSDYILVSHTVLAPDGKRMALGDDWTTLVKDVETNQTLCRLNLPASAYPLSFSADGGILALAGEEGTHFHDATTGEERGWLKHGDGWGHFVGDGRQLVCVEERSLLLREMGDLFAHADKAPLPARTDPPGVPLEAELVARQDVYALDLGGDTANDFSTRLQFGDDVPEPPRVDLILKFRNTGKEIMTLRNPLGLRGMYLIGPGALSCPYELRQTGVGITPGPGPEVVTLAPGESHSLPITSLSATGFAYWLLPGEYLIGGKCDGEISPPPPGSTKTADGFGSVSLRPTPVKVKVVPGKDASEQGLRAAASEIRRPPPPGTEIVPTPDDGSARTRETLAFATTMSLDADTPLKEALEVLNIRYDLDLRLDEAAFAKAGKLRIADARVECPQLDVSLRAIIPVILNQVDAQLDVRGRTIWILPAVKPQSLAERLYPATLRFRELLDESVTRKGGESEIPLSEALQYFKNEFELAFVLDARSFERAGVRDIQKRPVRLGTWTNVCLRDVLEQVLRQAGATCVARDRGLLVVIPPQK